MVEINSGVYLLKSQIRQVRSFTSSGLGLGLKNFVLFTSLLYNLWLSFPDTLGVQKPREPHRVENATWVRFQSTLSRRK